MSCESQAELRTPHPSPFARRAWAGFTLVELLVVIAIIGILVAMLLPGIQAARERARMAQCSNKMLQLSMGLHRYEDGHEHLPSGVTNPTGPIYNAEIGNHISWLAHLLPYVDEKNLYDHIDFSASAYAPVNEYARSMSVPMFLCPSAGWSDRMMTNYVGCHHDAEVPIDADNNGVLFLNSRVRLDDVTDGLAYTIFIGEKQTYGLLDPNTMLPVSNSGMDKDLGWLSGTRATLRNTGTPMNKTLDVSLLFTAAWPPNPDPADWRDLIDDRKQSRLEKLGNEERAAEEAKEEDGAVNQENDTADNQDAKDPETDGADSEADSDSKPAATNDVNKTADADKAQLQAPIAQLDPAWLNTPAGAGPNPLLYVGGFGSEHSHGANFAFGDGSVKFLTSTIDEKLYERMGARADGKLIDSDQLRD